MACHRFLPACLAAKPWSCLSGAWLSAQRQSYEPLASFSMLELSMQRKLWWARSVVLTLPHIEHLLRAESQHRYQLAP